MGVRERVATEFLPADKMVSGIVPLSVSNGADRACSRCPHRYRECSRHAGTGPLSRNLSEGERKRVRMRERKKKYMPLTRNDSVERILYVKLGPTLSCISPKHRDPRGRARGSAPEDMQQSPLMTPKSSCRAPLLRGREHCYLGGREVGGSFQSRLSLITPSVLETKGRRTRGFVKKIKR